MLRHIGGKAGPEGVLSAAVVYAQLFMKRAGSGHIIVPCPVDSGLGYTGSLKHSGIIHQAHGVHAKRDTKSLAVQGTGLEEQLVSAAHVDNAGIDILVQRIEHRMIGKEVVSHLEHVVHVVGGNQRIQLGKVVVKAHILRLELYTGMAFLIHRQKLHGGVVAGLGTPPGDAKGGVLRTGSGYAQSKSKRQNHSE